MSQNSQIEWTHHTFNPWWGCAKISEGCKYCYAEALANRFHKGLWGAEGDRRPASDSYWAEPLKWNRRAERLGIRERVFCASMADVFEGRSDLNAHRNRLWKLIEQTPQLDWLLLTKRPDCIQQYAPGEGFPGNVWLGATVEDSRAGRRIDALLACNASIKFLSVEPLIGPPPTIKYGIDWVIVGGESGRGSRPMMIDWARQVRDQCNELCIPFFFKQWGGMNKSATGRLLDGREHNAIPSFC